MSHSPQPQTRPPKRPSKLQRLLCCTTSSSPILSPLDAQPASTPSLSQALNGNGTSNGSSRHLTTSRPYFIPFECPWLPTKTPYDYHPEGFWDFPDRAGWILDGKCEYRKFPQATDLSDAWLVDAKDLDGKYRCRQKTVPEPSITKRPRDSLSLKCFRADSREATLTEEVAFLQAWLFFGVLAEMNTILGVRVDVESEVVLATQGGTGTKHLSTSILDRLPHQWLGALNALNEVDRVERSNRILQIVQHVMSLQTIISTRKSEAEDPQLLTYDECKVLLSVRVLFRAILLTLALCSPTTLDKIKPFVHPALSQSFPAYWDELKDFAIDEMLNKGWCRSECKVLEPFDGIYNFFAARLSSGRWTMDHNGCNDSICLADQVNEKTYESAHVERGCKCTLVKVKIDEVCAILDKGKIPRITISKDFKLSVNDSQPYVAISHVWSHGIGNPNENALPLCQVRRLSSLMSGLRDVGEASLALWIDTLCAPVQISRKVHRKKAVILMSQTYQDASAVLVLDRELQRLDTQKVSLLEQDMLTAFVGWTRRLWTLQEVAFAKRLYFQASRGPFKVENSKPHPNQQELLASQICFRDEIEGLIRSRAPSIDQLRKSVLEKSKSATVAATALQRLSVFIQHRATSKMEDEAVILASTLGLDVKEVLDSEDVDSRMAKFLCLIREVPSDIIFGTGERIGKSPYRWAPKSLLNSPIFNLQSSGPPASCDSRGLYAQYQGFLIEGIVTENQASDRYYAIEEKSNTKYEFQPREDTPNIKWPEKPALIFRPIIGGDAAVMKVLQKDMDEGHDVLEVTLVGYLRMVASGAGLDFSAKSPMKGLLTNQAQRWRIM
ncbi:hypothetical protein QCA50_014057 [Cerrena zonata]|uniref:Heterokaryon incompatibility domain-containing protein n=1 Tax=Cerrena zonata TaxID=2478898 RepID=A0AAW0FWV6_9APHY